jgi:preprotein translocase subunit SecA
MRYAWGRSEWSRLASTRPADLDGTTQRGLENLLGEDRYSEVWGQALQEFNGDELTAVVDELGRQALTEVYRQLLLGVISELWVEYLTNMEALRVSIGLEAYAQRDPLVQYKNRAFTMFRELLDNMRTGVVSRMFTFRPRDISTVQTTVSALRAETPEPAAMAEGPINREQATGSASSESRPSPGEDSESRYAATDRSGESEGTSPGEVQGASREASRGPGKGRRRRRRR